MTDKTSVLLVEDDDDLRASLETFLDLAGMEVAAVPNSLSYYRALAERTFTVAVIDLGLPDEAGEALVDFTRRTTGSKIVVVTARNTLGTRVDCYRGGPTSSSPRRWTGASWRPRSGAWPGGPSRRKGPSTAVFGPPRPVRSRTTRRGRHEGVWLTATGYPFSPAPLTNLCRRTPHASSAHLGMSRPISRATSEDQSPVSLLVPPRAPSYSGPVRAFRSIPPRLLVVLVTLLPVLRALAGSQQVAVPSGVSYEPIGSYSVERLGRIMTTELVEQGFADKSPTTFPPARYAVKLYRVTYPSVVPEQSNRPTVASGLVAVPDTPLASMPVVSYQHGTVFSKTEVPSSPEESMETRLMVARFAGQGYVVVAADYFGKGQSSEPDSYLVKGSTQQACFDMLLAARGVLASLKVTPGPLFLSGWSQGGWATLSFLQRLEGAGIAVTAAATASAPTDVYVTTNRWIHNRQPIDASYLTGVVALQILAQESYYGRDGLAASAIESRYLAACRDLYANRIGWAAFKGMTPASVKEMLRPEFVASGLLGETAYWQTLQEEHGCRWKSRTQMRCYYGDIDEVVPVAIAKLPELLHTLMGAGPTTSVPAGAKADHRGTFLFEVEDAGKWFDTLRAAPRT